MAFGPADAGDNGPVFHGWPSRTPHEGQLHRIATNRVHAGIAIAGDCAPRWQPNRRRSTADTAAPGRGVTARLTTAAESCPRRPRTPARARAPPARRRRARGQSSPSSCSDASSTAACSVRRAPSSPATATSRFKWHVAAVVNPATAPPSESWTTPSATVRAAQSRLSSASSYSASRRWAAAGGLVLGHRHVVILPFWAIMAGRNGPLTCGNRYVVPGFAAIFGPDRASSGPATMARLHISVSVTGSGGPARVTAARRVSAGQSDFHPYPLTCRFLNASRWKFKSRAPPRGRRPRVAGSGVWAPLLYAHRMVFSPRAGYRITKKTGRAVNRTIKQTKTATSILLPQCLATDRGFRRRGFLTYDTRAGGPRFIRARGWSKGEALAADGLRVGVGHPDDRGLHRYSTAM
jgi:hypothetical protein